MLAMGSMQNALPTIENEAPPLEVEDEVSAAFKEAELEKKQSEIDESKYKTKPCRFFRDGACTKADKCPYLHDEPFTPSGEPTAELYEKMIKAREASAAKKAKKKENSKAVKASRAANGSANNLSSFRKFSNNYYKVQKAPGAAAGPNDLANVTYAQNNFLEIVNGNGKRTEIPEAVRERLYKTKPCKFFQQGRCNKGGECPFIHTQQDATDAARVLVSPAQRILTSSTAPSTQFVVSPYNPVMNAPNLSFVNNPFLVPVLQSPYPAQNPVQYTQQVSSLQQSHNTFVPSVAPMPFFDGGNQAPIAQNHDVSQPKVVYVPVQFDPRTMGMYMTPAQQPQPSSLKQPVQSPTLSHVQFQPPQLQPQQPQQSQQPQQPQQPQQAQQQNSQNNHSSSNNFNTSEQIRVELLPSK